MALFLEFATEVKWATIERIAGFNALDTWILFPVSAITRMLPKSRRRNFTGMGQAANADFGDESWHNLYQEDPQGNLFGGVEYQREPRRRRLISLYKEN